MAASAAASATLAATAPGAGTSSEAVEVAAIVEVFGPVEAGADIAEILLAIVVLNVKVAESMVVSGKIGFVVMFWEGACCVSVS